MRHLATAAAVLVAVLVAALLLTPRFEAEAAEKVPLYFGLAFNRPTMVTVETKQSGYVNVNAKTYSYDSDLEFEEEMVFVDEYKTYSKEKERAVRHYLKDFSTTNGDNTDTALNGVRADYSRDDQKWRVQLLDNRILTDRLLDYLLAGTDSLGCWVELPNDKFLGESFQLDLWPIYTLITGPLDQAETAAKVRIDSYDRVTTHAMLKGEYEIKGFTTAAGSRTGVTYKGKIELEVRSAESRIVRAHLDGTYRFTGPLAKSSAKVSGDGDYDVTITTEIDLKKIKKRSKKKPKFRTKKFRAYALGVGIRLPSHWSRVAVKSPDRAFVRTLESQRGEAIITLEHVDAESSSNPGLYYDQVFAALKKTYPGVVYKKVKNPLGGKEGRVYYIPKGKDAGADAQHMQTELYPFRDTFVMLKLYGPPAAYHAALKDFKRAKTTLRPLNPKRGK